VISEGHIGIGHHRPVSSIHHLASHDSAKVKTLGYYSENSSISETSFNWWYCYILSAHDISRKVIDIFLPCFANSIWPWETADCLGDAYCKVKSIDPHVFAQNAE